jgi:hypothetical protein
MGKPMKKVTTTKFVPDDDDTPGAPAGWDMPGESELSEATVKQVLSGFGDGEIKIKFTKLTNPNAGYCYSTDGEIDEDFLQSTFGGGKYVAKIFINGEFKKAVPLSIAERKGSGANGGMAADVQYKLLEQQISFLKDQLMAQQNNRPQSSVSELADAMLKLQALNGGGGTDKSIELILKGIELGRNGGDKGGDFDWLSIIKEALPIVGTMVNKSPGITAGNPQANQQAPAQNTLPASKADDLIRSGLAYLKQQAYKGKDPLLFVDWIAANADEPQYQSILQFVLASDLPALAAIDPDVAKPPIDAWFTTFLDGLRQAFTPVDQVEGNSSGSSGDDSHVGGNGTSGKGGKPESKTKKAR